MTAHYFSQRLINMPFYMDKTACRGCGIGGVSRRTCPECPCIVCGEEGHMADNCPGLSNRYCEDCKVHGHWTNDQYHCPKQRQRNLKATGALDGGASSTIRSSTGVSARGASVRVGSTTGGSPHVTGKRRETPTIPTVPNKRHKAGYTPQGSEGAKQDLERNQTYKPVDDKQLPVLSLRNTTERFPNLEDIWAHLLQTLEPF